MSDIGNWLEAQGLGRFSATFVENEIEVGDLTYLEEADLEKLGLPMGPRKRLLAAIAAGSHLDLADDASAVPEPGSSGAERRQLTVMFCDLVDSVGLGQRLDLEDYRDLLAQVREAAVSAVERFHGFVARHQGDGMLAYFGYPAASEDDAERAVHAGLAVVEAIDGLTVDLGNGDRPRMRVGIATGPAIVGDVLATGSSEQSELAALGTTPNLAARLQGEAKPDEVVVSGTTRELCRSTFEILTSRRPSEIRRPRPTFRSSRSRRESRQTMRQWPHRLRQSHPQPGKS